MPFQWVDLFVIIIVGLSSITGLFRGFIREAVAIGGWLVGIWAGYNYSPSLARYLQPYISNQTAQTILSFMIILIGVLIAGSIVNFVLGLFLRGSGLGGMDKVLGAFFGFGRGVFIVSLIIAMINMSSLPYEKTIKSSQFYSALSPVVDWVSSYIPHLINKAKSVSSISGFIDIIPEI